MSRETLIEINDLTKVYTDSEEKVIALNGINLSVKEGEIYGIVGMSGAGKSTLIRCINRLDLPSKGEVLYRGRDILKMNVKELQQVRRKMGMIFQQFNLLMQRTVGQNVRYPLEIAGVAHAQAEAKVKELLEIVGISEKINAYPSQLSGGQRQRVAIARALASNPEVLLCDEATSALDPMTTQSILDLLQDINRRLGITVILITHEMAVIRQICTKVAILDGGRIVEEGSVDEVFVHTKSEAGKRLFGILPKEPGMDPETPAIRIVFDGVMANRPIIASLVQDQKLMINILSANIDHLGGRNFGQMLIERPEKKEESDRLILALRDQGLTVEEVHKNEL